MKADGKGAAKELIFTAYKLGGGGGVFGCSLLSRIAGDMEILLDSDDWDGVRLRRLANVLAGIVDAGDVLRPDADVKLLEDLADALLPPD